MLSSSAITAALIVRDEERFLAGCLTSIADAVDEVVIVDTGSRDRTVEIARAHGARVIEQRWADDFSAARNTSLEVAHGDWILYIDADERLSLPEGHRLADDLTDGDAFAALVRFIPTLNSTAYREYRLFRNDPRLRFKGAMHETILPDLEALQRSIGARVVESAATITHLGYEGDLTRKFQRNLPWLRAAVVQQPERLYYWYDLARCLVGLDQATEAEAIAVGAFTRASESGGPRDRAIGSALADQLAQFHLQRGTDPMPIIDAGLALKPDQPRLLFLKAQALFARGELEAAHALLVELCSIDPDALIDPTIGYDRRLFTACAPHLLGLTLLRLGRVGEAASALARAATAAPDEAGYAANVEVLPKAARRG